MSTSPSNDALRKGATEALKATDRLYVLARKVHEANVTEHDPADWAFWIRDDAITAMRAVSVVHKRICEATAPQTEEPF